MEADHVLGRLIAVSLLLIAACGADTAAAPTVQGDTKMAVERELIIVSATPADDNYYAPVADQVFDYHIAFGKAVLEHDDFLVLTRPDLYADYVAALGAERVAIAPQADIWARDFGLLNTAKPAMFRYTAEGQGAGPAAQASADYVQEVLADVMIEAGLSFTQTDLLNDGGNYVDDNHGRVVLSRKFLRDNGLSETEGRTAIQQTTGAEFVAFIDADEEGGLEHADGIVAFLDANLLLINRYPDDQDYATKLEADLRAALPDVQIHTIVTPYDDSRIYDDEFGSACGLYTNMLVTPDRIYLPQFGIAEDSEALALVRSLTPKHVVPVRTESVCHMGGGVRCLSWQVRGANAVMLKAWAQNQAR